VRHALPRASQSRRPTQVGSCPAGYATLPGCDPDLACARCAAHSALLASTSSCGVAVQVVAVAAVALALPAAARARAVPMEHPQQPVPLPAGSLQEFCVQPVNKY